MAEPESKFWTTAAFVLGIIAAVIAIGTYLAKPEGAQYVIAIFAGMALCFLIYAFYSQKKSYRKRLVEVVGGARREGETARDSVLRDVLLIEAYCDMTRGHGMFYTDTGILIRFGLRAKNTGRRTLRPVEIESIRIVPDWRAYQTYDMTPKSQRLSKAESIGYTQSTEIGEFEIQSRQHVDSPPHEVFGNFKVWGTLTVDTGTRDERYDFEEVPLGIPVSGDRDHPLPLSTLRASQPLRAERAEDNQAVRVGGSGLRVAETDDVAAEEAQSEEEAASKPAKGR